MPNWIYLVIAIIGFTFVGLFIIAIFLSWGDIKHKLPAKQPKRGKTGLPFIDGTKDEFL
ncbi:MAG: hypothetical protein ACK5MH_05030 [Bacteroidales bacterium]